MSHHRQVKRVPSRQIRGQDDLLGTLEVLGVQGKELVDDSHQDIEGGLDGVTPIDRCVTVEDLLQNLDITDKTFVGIERLIQNFPRANFVGMRSPYEVHGDVGVDENQSSARLVTALDLREHFIYVRCREFALHCSSYGLTLQLCGMDRLIQTRLAQCLTDPFRQTHVISSSDLL
jgi:hypothetical protein